MNTQGVSNLWSNYSFQMPIKYLFSSYIRDYDISKANISALLHVGRIDQSQYNQYFVMPKDERERSIGIWEGNDPTVYNDIQKGIIWAKQQFFLANQIQDHEVFQINNDSVVVLNKDCLNTNFGVMKFKNKGTFTSYVTLGKYQVFYTHDNMTDNHNVEVKGISDRLLPIHFNGFLGLICEILYMIETQPIQDVSYSMTDIFKRYVELEMPIEMYREFSPRSQYIIRGHYGISYGLDIISKDHLKAVDINHNVYLLRELWRIVSDLYMSSRKG